jgi:hypothetical protein
VISQNNARSIEVNGHCCHVIYLSNLWRVPSTQLIKCPRNFFGIPRREKSGNLWRIKVELTKQGKVLQGTIISMFYSNFPIVKWRDQCIFPLSNKPNFMFLSGKIKFLMVPKEIV